MIAFLIRIKKADQDLSIDPGVLSEQKSSGDPYGSPLLYIIIDSDQYYKACSFRTAASCSLTILTFSFLSTREYNDSFGLKIKLKNSLVHD